MDDKCVALNVSFDERDDVKRYGARWDGNQKTWYISCENPLIMKVRNYFAVSVEEVEKKIAKLKRDVDRAPKPIPAPKKTQLYTTRPVVKLEPGQMILATTPIHKIKPAKRLAPVKLPKPLKQMRIATFNSLKP